MPSEKLPRAPLILVLAEVHFSPVLATKRSIPAIQDQLRNKGFPDYDVGCTTAEQGWSDSIENTRWKFVTGDNRTSITLATDYFALETSDYSVFGDFLQLVRSVTDIISTTTKPEFLGHISLRYIDLIRDIDGKKAGDLIQPTIIQLSIPSIATDSHYRYAAAQFATSSRGIVRVNAMESCDEMIISSDIDPTVDLPVELQENEKKIILDIDHLVFFQEEVFSTETICREFRKIHEENVWPTFEAIVTDEALQLWRKAGE